MLETLREFVECESPSTDKAAVNRFATLVGAHFESLGGKVRTHHLRQCGNALEISFTGASRSGRVMLLGHLDTVYELGTLARMKWREQAGRAYGPGVFDMKSGIVQMLFALEALIARDGSLPRPVTVLLNPDEEIGSPHSRAITEKLAQRCAAVLVLEPSAGTEGACKTARKGVGVYRLKVYGREAHAGLDFEKGASAITELARQVTRIADFSDLKQGLTVNPGVVRGGTRANVVAAEAEVTIDVRVVTPAQVQIVERKLRQLRPFDPRCRLELAGGMTRHPFVRSRATAGLYEKARLGARELGVELPETMVGGGSDGNFTAALGVPTLDGLGAVGDGAHTSGEFIFCSELPRRTALLARLIELV